MADRNVRLYFRECLWYDLIKTKLKMKICEEVNCMKCPLCDNEMENGFIQAGRVMLWVQKPHKVTLLPRNNEVEIVYEPNPFIIPSIPAEICKKCKKIWFDYEGN